MISLGLLSSNETTQNTRLYAARPILASCSCKQENAEDHANLLSVTIAACCERKDVIGAELFCIASDGEARRGQSLVLLTQKHSLKDTSPLFPLLSNLTLLSKLVGDNDLTCDKDYKHVFKRMRSLLLRTSGS